MGNDKKTILVVDDHELTRDAIEACAAQFVGQENVIGVGSIREARTLLGQLKSCHLLVLDLSLSDSSGISTVTQIRDDWPDVPVLVVSGEDDLQMQSIIKLAGVAGFVSKIHSMKEVTDAIGRVLEGGKVFDRKIDVIDSNELETRLARVRSLTNAQRRVLDAMMAGAATKHIAYDLGISEATVKFHLKKIFLNLQVSNRTMAVVEFKELLKYV
jgi:DNA-binding NarL/FixJ family response regulator